MKPLNELTPLEIREEIAAKLFKGNLPMPSPNLTKLLETLKRCDAEMTNGPWKAGRADMTTHDALSGDGPYKHVYVARDLPEEDDDGVPAKGYGPKCVANAHGIATLRNLVAAQAKIIEVAIGALRFVAEECDLGDVRSRPAIWAALATIESLAAQANKDSQ